MATERLVNLNNAGCSTLNPGASERVRQYWQLEDSLGGYEAESRSEDEVAKAYEILAQTVGAEDPQEIAFMDSATRAWNTFVYSLQLEPGNKILTGVSEFGTNLLSLRHIALRTGATIELVSCDEDGALSVEDLERRLDGDVALVAVSHVPAHRGVINPVEEIGQLVSAHPRARYIVDCCQSLGQIPVDVDRFRCDALSATGRKWLRGPRGTGFLYVSRDAAGSMDPLTVDRSTAAPLTDIADPISLVDGARRFETWERNVGLFLGLARAAEDYLDRNPATVHRAVRERASQLRAQLAQLDGTVLQEPVDAPCGIVTFSIPGRDAGELKSQLADNGFAVSAAYAVNAPLDFKRLGHTSLVRASPHYYTGESDIDDFARTVDRLLS